MNMLTDMDDDAATAILRVTHRSLCKRGYIDLTLCTEAAETGKSRAIIHATCRGTQRTRDVLNELVQTSEHPVLVTPDWVVSKPEKEPTHVQFRDLIRRMYRYRTIFEQRENLGVHAGRESRSSVLGTTAVGRTGTLTHGISCTDRSHTGSADSQRLAVAEGDRIHPCLRCSASPVKNTLSRG